MICSRNGFGKIQDASNESWKNLRSMKRGSISSTSDIHRSGRLRGGCCFVRFILFSPGWEFIHFLCQWQLFTGAMAASFEAFGELPEQSKRISNGAAFLKSSRW